MSPELIFDAQAALGEGALWDSRRQQLLWVDILGMRCWRSDPVTGQHSAYDIGQFVGTVVPRRSGGVMLAVHRGLASYDFDTRQLRFWCDPENNSAIRFNDGKCDPAGRFWVGTMPLQSREPLGHLFCLDPDGRCECKISGVSISNGLAWSQDRRTMYYIDTPTQMVVAYDYDDATGAIARPRPVIRIDPAEGHPDGLTLDANGNLWIALWDGGAVVCHEPRTGRRVAKISVPAQRVTACAFGGPRLDQLYITTARTGLDEAQLARQPHAGGLFCVEAGVGGLPAGEFAG
jgi:sugar lactone lactonase YvrE